MLLRRVPSGSGPGPPDGEDLPSSGPEYISRARLLKGSPPSRLPITAQLLSKIRSALDGSCHPEKSALWAVYCTAFFGFFRLGELLLDLPAGFNQRLHLARGDVAVDDRANPGMVQIHLKQSKTDQFRKGFDIILGRTNTILCPVAALLAYIAVRGDRTGPFFIDSGARPVTKACFVAELRSVLRTVGVPQVQGTVSALGRPPRQPWPVSKIQPSRHWAGGIVLPFCTTSGCRGSSWRNSRWCWRPLNQCQPLPGDIRRDRTHCGDCMCGVR